MGSGQSGRPSPDAVGHTTARSGPTHPEQGQRDQQSAGEGPPRAQGADVAYRGHQRTRRAPGGGVRLPGWPGPTTLPGAGRPGPTGRIGWSRASRSRWWRSPSPWRSASPTTPRPGRP
jgi:hypothetical protein